jgi:hypothetical protein
VFARAVTFVLFVALMAFAWIGEAIERSVQRLRHPRLP